MGLLSNKKRQIDIDIVANNQASDVFNDVGNDAQTFGTRVNSSINSLNRGLRQYNSYMSNFNRNTQVAMAVAGYSIYNFTSGAIKEFAEFERQHGLTMGAIAGDYDNTAEAQARFLETTRKLKEESLKLGTVGPTGAGSLYNPQEVAFAQTALSKAGMKDYEISQVLPTIIQFAGGSDLGMETGAEYAVNLSKMFDIPIDQWQAKLDEITRAADMSTIDVPDIMETLRYAGPIAHSLGRDLEEVLSMIITMGNAGISGSMAGTGIQAFFSRILAPRGLTTASATAPSEYAEEMFMQFSDNAVTASGSMKSAAEVTALLDDIMSTMDDREQAWFATKLFGLFQMKAGYTLSKNGGEVLRDIEDELTETAVGTNATKWDIMLNTSYGKQEKFRNILAGTQTDLGYRLSPLTNAIIDEIFNVLADPNNYKIDFKNIDTGIKDASALITEKYGNQAGEIAENVMNLGINASQIGSAMLPFIPGTLQATGKLLGGDFQGAWDVFSDSLGKVNENIDGLPSELRTMAEETRNVILALMALSGINFATKILENVTSLWTLTAGKMIGGKVLDSKLSNVGTMTVNAAVVNINSGVSAAGGATGTAKTVKSKVAPVAKSLLPYAAIPLATVGSLMAVDYAVDKNIEKYGPGGSGKYGLMPEERADIFETATPDVYGYGTNYDPSGDDGMTIPVTPTRFNEEDITKSNLNTNEELKPIFSELFYGLQDRLSLSPNINIDVQIDSDGGISYKTSSDIGSAVDTQIQYNERRLGGPQPIWQPK